MKRNKFLTIAVLLAAATGSINYALAAGEKVDIVGGGPNVVVDKAVAGDTTTFTVNVNLDQVETNKNKITAIETLIDGAPSVMDRNLGNISNDGEEQLKEMAKFATEVAGGQNITVVENDQGGKRVWTVNVDLDAAKAAIEANMQPTLDAKLSTDLANIAPNGKIAISELAKQAVELVAGQNTTVESTPAIDKTTWKVNVDFTPLENKIQNNKNDIDQLKLDVTAAANGVAQNLADVTRIDLLSRDNKTALDQLKTSVDENERNIAENKTALTTANAEALAAKTLANTNKTTLDALAPIVNKNKDDILTNKQTIQANRIDIDEASTDIQNNRNLIGDNTTAIANNKKEIKKVDDRVTAVEGLATTNKNNIDQVRTAVDNIINNGAPGGGASIASVEKNSSKIAANSERITKLDDQMQHQGALSAALASLHVREFDGINKTQILGGVGYYGGKVGMALGVAHEVNDLVSLQSGIAFDSGDKVMANLGVNFKIGKGGMARTTVEKIKNENAMLKKELESVKAKNAEMQEQINKLMRVVGLA